MSTPVFVHPGQPTRVVFGAGRIAAVPEEVERLAIRRVLVASTPGRAELARRVHADLGERGAATFTDAAQHVPVDLAERAVERARSVRADGVVAIGGGSTVGLAKAIALRAEVPVLACPTTYAGSELTPIWGLTDADGKRTGRDPRVLPTTVIYDPELAVTLSPETSVASGLNAVAHAVEAAYAPDRSPLVATYAAESVRALATALPEIVTEPTDLGARSRAAYGAWLAGSCLGLTSMGLHHKLCHVLGGRFGLPHAETHAALLPHVLAFHAPAAPEAVAVLAGALGTEDVAGAVHDLGSALGDRRSLRRLGLAGDALPEAADAVLAAPPDGPRRLTVTGLTEVLAAAYDGLRPC